MVLTNCNNLLTGSEGRLILISEAVIRAFCILSLVQNPVLFPSPWRFRVARFPKLSIWYESGFLALVRAFFVRSE